jgi:alpha-amylase
VTFSARSFGCALGACVVVLLAGCGGGGGGGDSSPVPPPTQPSYVPTGKGAAGEAMAVLWEWPWSDVAVACETTLSAASYGAVLVSAPNEHAVIRGFPWTQRYQPVSYRLERTRSGTAGEFGAMVDRCRRAGVEVLIDAVINHMAADSGINAQGSAGNAYQKYEYPAVPYQRADFHPACGVSNYQDANNVQNCELLGLPDLDTGAASVRRKIADYLIAVSQLGVRGFRIDAAKHIAPTELDAIVGLVNAAAVAAGRARPYFFLEVINNAAEAVTAQQYFGVGYASGGASDLTEFQATYAVSDAFLKRNGRNLAGLATFGAGLLPADKALTFVANHDTERGSLIAIDDGAAYRLAQVFLLAHPYGYPAVHSGYAFSRATQAERERGPYSDAGGATQRIFPDGGGATIWQGESGCAPGAALAAFRWTCDHATYAGMVALRRYAAGAPLAQWQSSGPNQIAFARAGKAFVAINREDAATTAGALQTTLPAGRYCDVAGGSFDPAARRCSGPVIAVGADGIALVAVPGQAAVALHGGARLD